MAVLASCSTQKAKWGNIAFHNTTTHYNIWWNGNESLKKGVENLNKNVKDDYTRLLPVYKLGTKEESMAMLPDFNRAIEKGVKGIKKHSIFVDGREHVPYIAKCYLLTAQAAFYEHDYVTAANTCQLLISQYAGQPVADEAAVLMARCSTQEKRYREAETALDELVVADGKGEFDKSQRLNLALAMAECALPQEKYKKGVQFLKQALEQKPPARQKARIYFILGQVYQQLDKRPTAAKYYEKALACGPDYEMEFNARLNIASCADLRHSDIGRLEKLLDKMLSDKKNEEFADQIYYAKGEMYLGMRKVKEGCAMLRKSAAVSKANPAQKARSSLRLAGVLYDKMLDYDNAQRYYDTAMSLIKPDYPRYADIKSRHELLTSLVSYTRVIASNDSLIAVAELPEKKRDELIASKIETLIRQEKEAKERELLEEMAADDKAQMNTLKGDWYFYNSNMVSKGKETFRQRWGARALEDYWFLSNRGLLGMNMLALAEPDSPDTPSSPDTAQAEAGDAKAGGESEKNKLSGNPDDPHDPAYYLKSIPKSQAEKDSMLQETSIALLNAGYLYYEGVANTAKALECYLRMANSFTRNPEIVQAFFMLYKIYDKQGNTPSSNYYRDMVLMGFPDSDFANLILDEDYYKEILRRGRMVREDYAELYALARKKKYDDVLRAAAAAKELYPGDPMLSKYRYWEGIAYAKMDNRQQAVAAFEGILADYPATDSIVPLAQAQLDYLRGGGEQMVLNSGAELMDQKAVLPADPADKAGAYAPKAMNPDDLPPEAQLFRFRESMPHFVIILTREGRVKATDLQVKVGDFNMQYYANAGFKVSPLLFTDTLQMITITSFPDAAAAMDYYRHLFRPESPLSDYGIEQFRIFAISKQNYTTFYNRKKIDAYQQFFDLYYLTK